MSQENEDVRAEAPAAPCVSLVRGELLAFGCVFLILLGLALCLPYQLFGGATEHLGMAASMLRTHDLIYQREDLLACAEMIPPETYLPDARVGYTKRNRDGDHAWGVHSVYYAVLGTPFVAVFGGRGFFVLNAACFTLILALLYCRLREVNSWVVSFWLAAACVCLSPALSYVFWIQSEVVTMALLLGALFFGFRGKVVGTGLCLGAAVAMWPMLVLALAPILVWHFRTDDRCGRMLWAILIAGVALAPQVVYSFWQFGTLNPWAGWMSARYIHVGRVIALWLDPAEGMLWFYPAIVWCLVRNRWPRPMLATLALTALAVSVSLCGTPALHTHQIGWRCCMLVFPFFLMMPGTWRGQWRDWAAVAYACFLGSTLLLDPLGGSGIYHGRCNLPLKISALWGSPSYSERFFATPNRLSRDVAFDYIDSWHNVRKKRVQIQVRNAEEGALILKLYLTPGLKPGEARLALGGTEASAPLEEGRVATLTLPMDQRDFVDCIVQGRKVPVARLTLDAPLSVMSGEGELLWQKRYFVREGSFLYQAGPAILDVFPNAGWVLQTLGSAVLGAEHADYEPICSDATRLPAISMVKADVIEGVCAFMCRPSADVAPADFSALELPTVALPEIIAGLTKVQVTGWFKVTPAEESKKAFIVVEWLKEDGEVVQRIDKPCGVGPDGKWGYMHLQLNPPDEATHVRFAMGLRGPKGTLKVDDFVVSKYLAPW